MENEKNNHNPLGDPLSSPNSKPQPKSDQTQNKSRPGDEGLGQPDFEPENVRVLSDKETEQYKESLEEELREKFEQKLKDLQQLNSSWQLPTGLKKAGAWLLVFIAAIAGIFIVNQAVQFSLSVNSLPLPQKWVAIAAMGLFSAVIVFVILWLLVAAIRLRRLKPVDIKALKILAERETMRRFASEKAGQARKMLAGYIADFPLSKKSKAALLAAGLRGDEIELMTACRDKLLDKSRSLPAEQWIDEFRDGFQSILDTAATRRVKDYSLKAGMGTAISPIAMVDQIIVFYSCFAMLKDIMKIYHLRPAFGQTAVVLSRSIINTYLSGVVGGATEGSAEGIAEYLQTHCGETIGNVVKVVPTKLATKAAEAGLNGFLIYSLGSRTIKMLQPIARK